MEQILRRGAWRDRRRRRPHRRQAVLEYDIDREAIARYGVNIRDVQDVIEIAIGGENLTTSVEGRERYPIRVRYPRELRENFDDLERILVPTSTGAQIPIGQVAKIRYTIGPQEIKSENGLLVGYVTLNTRDRDEVSVVEDAEALLQAEKRRSDELIAAGRHEEATLVVPAGYYWKWSGQFENQQRATQRLSWLVPLVLLAMFVMIYLGLGRWWLAFIVFFGIIVSASGGFLLLYLLGRQPERRRLGRLHRPVRRGRRRQRGDARASWNDNFKERQPTSIAEIRSMVIEAGLKRIRPLPDDDGHDGHRPDADLPDARPRLRRDAADGHSQRRRHGRAAHHALRGPVPVLPGQGVAVPAQSFEWQLK